MFTTKDTYSIAYPMLRHMVCRQRRNLQGYDGAVQCDQQAVWKLADPHQCHTHSACYGVRLVVFTYVQTTVPQTCHRPDSKGDKLTAPKAHCGLLHILLLSTQSCHNKTRQDGRNCSCTRNCNITAGSVPGLGVNRLYHGIVLLAVCSLTPAVDDLHRSAAE